MKKIILILALSFSSIASAGGYGYHGYRGNYYGNGWNYAGAFLGGALIGGVINSALSQPQPVYGGYNPYAPPVFVTPPPVYVVPQQVCEQKLVTNQYGNNVVATVCYNR